MIDYSNDTNIFKRENLKINICERLLDRETWLHTYYENLFRKK